MIDNAKIRNQASNNPIIGRSKRVPAPTPRNETPMIGDKSSLSPASVGSLAYHLRLLTQEGKSAASDYNQRCTQQQSFKGELGYGLNRDERARGSVRGYNAGCGRNCEPVCVSMDASAHLISFVAQYDQFFALYSPKVLSGIITATDFRFSSDQL
jgi:hypothetical protein